MLVVNPIPEDIFNYSFYSIKTPETGHFVSKCRWAVFMLACKPGNKILTMVANAFESYLSKTYTFIDYFLFDQFIDMLYNSDPEIKKMIDKIPLNNPEVHWLGNHLCETYNNNNFKRICSNTDMFKLSTRAFTTEQLHANPYSYYSKIAILFCNKISL